jgi:radical SAM superfamily enzyme YgiQ (UPF0313 family)
MAIASAMYHSGRSPLSRISDQTEHSVSVVKGERQRRLQKAFLRYHAEENWPVLREALIAMGRRDLIGHDKTCLVPPEKHRPGERSFAKKPNRHGHAR